MLRHHMHRKCRYRVEAACSIQPSTPWPTIPHAPVIDLSHVYTFQQAKCSKTQQSSMLNIKSSHERAGTPVLLQAQSHKSKHTRAVFKRGLKEPCYNHKQSREQSYKSLCQQSGSILLPIGRYMLHESYLKSCYNRTCATMRHESQGL